MTDNEIEPPRDRGAAARWLAGGALAVAAAAVAVALTRRRS
ncbi:hypothetical protein [Mycolicibacterium elephantis]|nr:hypothetical protein [Mycolicibacterium elephantis]